MVVVFPKGRAEEGEGLPGDGGDLFSRSGQVCHDFLGGERVEVGVGVRVTHHFMPRIGESLDRLRVFLHPVTHHKERGLDMVASQNVDELLGILVAPGECYRAALGGQGIAARSKPGVIKEQRVLVYGKRMCYNTNDDVRETSDFIGAAGTKCQFYSTRDWWKHEYFFVGTDEEMRMAFPVGGISDTKEGG